MEDAVGDEIDAEPGGRGGAVHAARAFAAIALLAGAWWFLRPDPIPLDADPTFAHLRPALAALEDELRADDGARPEPLADAESTTALEFQRRFDREASDLDELQHAEDMLAGADVDDELERFLEERDFAVRQMRRAAAAASRGSLYDDLGDRTTGGPDRATVRRTVVAAVIEARRAAAAGARAEAGERLVDLAQYGCDLVAGRNLASVGTGLDVLRVALDDLDALLGTGLLPDGDAAALHARLRATALTLPRDDRALLGEWVMTGRMFARAAAGSASASGRPDTTFLRGAAESWAAWHTWLGKARAALAAPAGAERLAALRALDDEPFAAGATGLQVRPPRLLAVAARMATVRARFAGRLAQLVPGEPSAALPDLHPGAVAVGPGGTVTIHGFTPDGEPWSAAVPAPPEGDE